jgi:hypothetical protein
VPAGVREAPAGATVALDQQTQRPKCASSSSGDETVEQTAQEVHQWEQAADQLIEEWRNRFGGASLPVNLTKIGNESRTLLRWRLAQPMFGKPRGARVELLDVDAAVAGLDSTMRRALASFERRRLRVNCQAAVAIYRHEQLVQMNFRIRQVRHLLIGTT